MLLQFVLLGPLFLRPTCQSPATESHQMQPAEICSCSVGLGDRHLHSRFSNDAAHHHLQRTLPLAEEALGTVCMVVTLFLE